MACPPSPNAAAPATAPGAFCSPSSPLPPLALAALYCLAGFIAVGQGVENVDRQWAQLCLLLFIGLFACATTLAHALVRAYMRRALVLAAGVYLVLGALRLWPWAG